MERWLIGDFRKCAAMKVAAIAVVSSLVVLCGCAGNRGYGQSSAPGGSGGGSLLPTPSTGTAAPSFPGFGAPATESSSSFKPSGNRGPVLGFPELPAAFDDNAAQRPTKTAQLQAPDPKSRGGRKPSNPDASTVSSADHSNDAPVWNRFYRSTDRRPIESLTLGTGPARIAIMASVHGDEVQSTGLVEELAKYLVQHPEKLSGTTLLLVKSPNPDGAAGRTPYNVNGVDLNRNFPADNWKLLEHNRAGAKARSEAETQVAVRLLSDFQPSLVVHLKDSRRGAVVNYEGDIRRRAEDLARMISGQVVQGLGEKTSGSVENFALTKLSCPSLTLLLVLESTDQAAWSKNQSALLSLCKPAAGQSSNGRQRSRTADEERANSIDDQPDPFEPPAVQKSSLRKRPGERTGNASKTSLKSQLPEFPAPVPDVGYLELPSP